MNLGEIKKIFKNKRLFDQAMTHRSRLNENGKSRESNERLEFLGDAVLELIVTEYLFLKFPIHQSLESQYVLEGPVVRKK